MQLNDILILHAVRSIDLHAVKLGMPPDAGELEVFEIFVHGFSKFYQGGGQSFRPFQRSVSRTD